MNPAPPEALDSLLQSLNRAVATSGRRVVEITAASLVHERPGRRRTYLAHVRVRRGDAALVSEVWYAKEYATTKAARSFHKLAAIHEAAPRGVRVPEPVGYSAEDRLVVTKEVPGPSLEAVLRNGSRLDVPIRLGEVGEALAGLHEVERSSLPEAIAAAFEPHGPGQERDVLAKARERFAAAPLEGDLRRRMDATVERALSLLGESAPAAPRLLHRDLHPGQILPTTGGVVLLDTDESAFGEPELDVGNLAAHLILERARHELEGAPEWVEAFQSGYRRRAALRPDRVAVYTASTLLRLASLERVANPEVSRLDWPRLAARLLEEAQRAVASGRDQPTS